jgi:hypothetical protein
MRACRTHGIRGARIFNARRLASSAASRAPDRRRARKPVRTAAYVSKDASASSCTVPVSLR